MGAFPLSGLLLPLALAAGPDPRADAGPGRPLPGGELSAEDARYLDWLIEDFLFDPRGAVRVRISHQLDERTAVPVPEAQTGHRDGWLVPKDGRIYFGGGDSIPVPTSGVSEVDYEAECESQFPLARWRPPTLGVQPVRLTLLNLSARYLDHSLADAAWLHRRGYDRLAARVLAAARASHDDPADALRASLAEQAVRAMTDAFVRRADAEAEEHGRRWLRLWPALAEPPIILTDLERRRRLGTFGKRAPGWPDGYAAWDDKKKAAYLIETLDEIGRLIDDHLDVTSHPRYLALVDLGDAAVPGLIDVLEKDDRLTRYVEPRVSKFGRHLRQEDRLVTVQDVAEQALRQIVRVSCLEPRLPLENDERSPGIVVGKLRRYWGTYGHLSFDDRMMAVLTDPDCRSEARAEAAVELVDRAPAGRSSWMRRTQRRAPELMDDRARVVDAILAALDEEREHEGRRRRPTYEERAYVRALTRLGDPRAGPELAWRARQEATVRSRLTYAQAAHQLGESVALIGLCRELATATLDLGPPRRGSNRSRRAVPDTLNQVLIAASKSALPDADAALHALTDPAHPYHALLFNDLVTARTPLEFEWGYHPFVVGILRCGLIDHRPTGVDYYLRSDEVEVLTPRRVNRRPVPEGATGWREHAEERVADALAESLSNLVVGLPEPHPLRPDADRVLKEMRTVLLKYDGRIRALNDAERTRLGLRSGDVGFAPDIKPLGRPATVADVNAGRAVFELNGRGRVAPGTWPAWVLLKADAENDGPWGLIVQAEVGADGAFTYGAIFRHAIRVVRADEVERIERP